MTYRYATGSSSPEAPLATPQTQSGEQTTPLDEMRKAIVCLALEVPEAVYTDVVLRWSAFVAEYERLVERDAAAQPLIGVLRLRAQEHDEEAGGPDFPLYRRYKATSFDSRLGEADA